MATGFATVVPVACAHRDWAKRHVFQLIALERIGEQAKKQAAPTVPPSPFTKSHQDRIDRARAARGGRP
jgi:hypothetical protein